LGIFEGKKGKSEEARERERILQRKRAQGMDEL